MYASARPWLLHAVQDRNMVAWRFYGVDMGRQIRRGGWLTDPQAHPHHKYAIACHPRLACEVVKVLAIEDHSTHSTHALHSLPNSRTSFLHSIHPIPRTDDANTSTPPPHQTSTYTPTVLPREVRHTLLQTTDRTTGSGGGCGRGLIYERHPIQC